MNVVVKSKMSSLPAVASGRVDDEKKFEVQTSSNFKLNLLPSNKDSAPLTAVVGGDWSAIDYPCIGSRI